MNTVDITPEYNALLNYGITGFQQDASIIRSSRGKPKQRNVQNMLVMLLIAMQSVEDTEDFVKIRDAVDEVTKQMSETARKRSELYIDEEEN